MVAVLQIFRKSHHTPSPADTSAPSWADPDFQTNLGTGVLFLHCARCPTPARHQSTAAKSTETTNVCVCVILICIHDVAGAYFSSQHSLHDRHILVAAKPKFCHRTAATATTYSSMYSSSYTTVPPTQVHAIEGVIISHHQNRTVTYPTLV